MSAHVVGVDLALGTTGIARHTGHVERIVTPSTMGTIARWKTIRDGILAACEIDDADPVVVILEDLPSARLAGAGQAVARLGMLHGVVRLALDDLADDLGVAALVLVQPATLKKYATGKGNAKKADVLAEAIRRLDYQGSDDNEADAMWLRQLGLAHYQPDLAAPMPKAHLAALDGIDWPDLEGAAE